LIQLSVNVNKIATIRNSRGGTVPSVIDAVDVCVDAGAPGITVHPRADERHITRADVRAIASRLRERAPGVEYNIEGDPRPDLVELVEAVKPTQCTLVPVAPGEVTSQAGWRPGTQRDRLPEVIGRLRGSGIRVSVFVDAAADPIQWAASAGADRVELYTEPFARAFERGGADLDGAFETFASAAKLAHQLGLGVNAGHDLDLDNLRRFRTLPFLAEVSIGHAIVSRAVFVGLATVVREYLDALAGR
jgi:pyridoxine 5-phosphate synthase